MVLERYVQDIASSLPSFLLIAGVFWGDRCSEPFFSMLEIYHVIDPDGMIWLQLVFVDEFVP